MRSAKCSSSLFLPSADVIKSISSSGTFAKCCNKARFAVPVPPPSGGNSLFSIKVRMGLVPGDLAHHVKRAVLYLIENAAYVLANDADRNELNASEEKDRNHNSCKPRRAQSVDQFLDGVKSSEKY